MFGEMLLAVLGSCLRCIKDWMSTKSKFHIIAMERKMIYVFGVISNHFSTGHPIVPPKAMPTCCVSVCHCHACLQFRRMLPICGKSGHVSTTLRNELQHKLLGTVSQKIGSTVIQSRKTKPFAYRVLLETSFTVSGKLSHTPTEKPVEDNDTYLNPGKKSENSCSYKSASRLIGFAGINALKMCGHGFGWGNGRGNGHDLVDVIGYHTTYPHHFPFSRYYMQPMLVLTQCLSSP